MGMLTETDQETALVRLLLLTLCGLPAQSKKGFPADGVSLQVRSLHVKTGHPSATNNCNRCTDVSAPTHSPCCIVFAIALSIKIDCETSETYHDSYNNKLTFLLRNLKAFPSIVRYTGHSRLFNYATCLQSLHLASPEQSI